MVLIQNHDFSYLDAELSIIFTYNIIIIKIISKSKVLGPQCILLLYLHVPLLLQNL